MRSFGTYIFFLISLISMDIQASNNDEFIKVLKDFLFQKEYALRYKSYLYTKSGEEVQVNNNNSVVVKEDLSLYTNTGDIIFIINMDGALLINNKVKKIEYNAQKLSKKQKRDRVAESSQKSYQGLSDMLKKSDSIGITTINGMTVYTAYLTDKTYSRSECWVDANKKIKEVRYYFNEGDYVYQKISYEPARVEEYKAQLEISNYISISKNKVVPNVKYKDYELVIGN